MSNPDNAAWPPVEQVLRRAGDALGVQTLTIPARTAEDIELALVQARERAQAVVVPPDPLFIEHREKLPAIAAKLRLPAVYGWSAFVAAGRLMSYSPDSAEMWERAAGYVDRILRGAKPADLPFVEPAKYLLTVNLRAAKALRLNFPQSILLRADEVIR